MNFVFFHLWMNFTMWLFSLFLMLLFMKIRAYFGTFIRAVHYYHSLLHMYGRVSVYHRVTSYTCKIDKLDWFKMYQWISCSSYTFYTNMISNYRIWIFWLKNLALWMFSIFLIFPVDFEIVFMEKWNFNTWLLMIDFIW